MTAERWRSTLAVVAILTVAGSCARGPSRLSHPAVPAGVVASTGATVNWTIALLGSGFSSEAAFKGVADSFVSEILADKEFGAAAGRKQITFVRAAVDPSLRTTKTNDRCGFSRNAALGKGIGTVVANENLAGLTSLIVLNDHASVDACAAGELFLADNGASRAGPHEFGHSLGGLFDELGGGMTRPGPVVGPNCVSKTEPLPWDPKLFPRGPQPGCWQDGNVLRPTDNCRMQTGTGKFCPACKNRLAKVFTTPVPPAAPTHTQFVLQVWAPSTFDVVSAKTYSQPAPPQVIRGPIVLGLRLDEDRICLGGSFAEPLISRGYRAPVETSWTKLTDGNEDSVFVILNCPGTVDRGQLRRFQEVRISPVRNIWLTPEIFLKNRLGEPRDFLVR